MVNILSTILGPVGNVATTFLKNKAAQSQAKHDAKMSVIQNNADWEAKMADASANSWKDEFWTLVLSAPIFMISYSIIVDDPSVIDRTKQAFTVLSELPEWYQYLLFVCISASFGIKGVDRLLSLKKK
tara:strand:- start:3914 stop:4297 length:384 start_codon:yes stop_codon:yes gene_type:complete